jgi:hypothetical protein
LSGRDHFRAFSRRAISVAATLVVENERDPIEREAKLVDLGLGGACVEVPDGVPVAASVRLSLTAPHRWDPLFVSGRVAWSRPAENQGVARVGIRFEASSGPTLRALVELLDTHAYG